MAGVHFSWNLLDDVRQLFEFPFMVNAFRAGTIVALVGFPGAAGAVWLGISATWGFFGFCLGAALLIAWLRPERGEGYSEESAGIGVVQAFALACGFLFVSLYRGFLNGLNALLFGSFLGITEGQVLVLLVVGAAALVVLAAVGRPLLFASVDPDVAAARGVRVRRLSVISAGWLWCSASYPHQRQVASCECGDASPDPHCRDHTGTSFEVPFSDAAAPATSPRHSADGESRGIYSVAQVIRRLQPASECPHLVTRSRHAVVASRRSIRENPRTRRDSGTIGRYC